MRGIQIVQAAAVAVDDARKVGLRLAGTDVDDVVLAAAAGVADDNVVAFVPVVVVTGLPQRDVVCAASRAASSKILKRPLANGSIVKAALVIKKRPCADGRVAGAVRIVQKR